MDEICAYSQPVTTFKCCNIVPDCIAWYVINYKMKKIFHCYVRCKFKTSTLFSICTFVHFIFLYTFGSKFISNSRHL
jgi:hypothetical protein